MLAIQIAAGIVLAVLVLRFWKQGLVLAGIGAGLVLIVLGGAWGYDVLNTNPDSREASWIIIGVSMLIVGAIRAVRQRNGITRKPPTSV